MPVVYVSTVSKVDRDDALLAGGGVGVAGLGYGAVPKKFARLPQTPERLRAGRSIGRHTTLGQVSRVPVRDIVPFTMAAGNRTNQMAHIASLAQYMQTGAELPAVKLRRVGSTYQVVDGAHRIAAARMMGLSHVPVYLEQGKSRTTPFAWEHRRRTLRQQANWGKQRSQAEIDRLARQKRQSGLAHRLNRKMGGHQAGGVGRAVRYVL